ncbi:hypothetical protein [Synechococcus sp. UW140]|nr:hypothetical protein [Synechococcus sp. UW140]
MDKSWTGDMRRGCRRGLCGDAVAQFDTPSAQAGTDAWSRLFA